VPDLLVTSNGQPDNDGTLTKITPESAGWEYVGFEVLRLEAGRSVSRHTGSEEVCLVPLSGTCTVSAGAEEWKDIGGRESVFYGPPSAVYLPPGSEYTVHASTGLEIAVASAPAERGVDPMVVRPENIEDLKRALAAAKDVDRTVVIHIPVDRYEGVPDYDSFWDVPVSEVSKMESVNSAREEYAENKKAERRYL